MTLSIPPANDWTTLQYALDLIAQKFPLGTQQIQNGAVTAPKLATGIVLQLNTTGTARKLAFGSQSVSFSATASIAGTVNHGLGSTPVLVMVGGAVNGVAAFDAYSGTPGGTTFPLTVAVRGGGSVTTTISIPWVAIG